MRSSTIVLLFSLLLSGCTGEEFPEENHPVKEIRQAKRSLHAQESADTSATDTESTFQIRFERDVTYGSTDEVVVGGIAAFAVDKQNRVFIADGAEINIKAFNPDGSYLTSLGRQGQGPGEFSAFSQFIIAMAIRSNMLYVTDEQKDMNCFQPGFKFFR